MKKLFFSLMMMLALVIVAGNAMAQTSTAPWKGTTYTYTVASLHAGDAVTVTLTPNGSVDATTGSIAIGASAGEGVWYIADNTLAALGADGNQSFDVTWGSLAVAGTPYKLWISVVGATGCSNYRYLTITPAENTFNLGIFAVGSGDENHTGLTLTSDNAPANECLTPAKLIGEAYDAAGITNDGTTYVYFRVVRTSPTATYAWAYDVTFTGLGSATATEFSLDGIDWTTNAFDATQQTIPATDNEVYIRKLIPAPLNASIDISGTISGQTLGSFDNTLVPDITPGDDTEASYIINARPSIGTFSGN